VGERSKPLRKVYMGNLEPGALKAARAVSAEQCPVFNSLRAAVKKNPQALTMLRSLEMEMDKIHNPNSRYLPVPKSVYEKRYLVQGQMLQDNLTDLRNAGLSAGPYRCLDSFEWTFAGCVKIYD